MKSNNTITKQQSYMSWTTQKPETNLEVRQIYMPGKIKMA